MQSNTLLLIYVRYSSEDKPNFDPDQFKKPFPNYSYVHDQYVLPSTLYKTRQTKKNNSSSTNHKEKTKTLTDYSKTGNAFTKLTNAQKLDNLIQAKSG